MSELFENSAEASHFESIRTWVLKHTGLHYPARKHSTLYHRLQKVCREMGFATLQELDLHLHQRDIPDLSVRLACAVSTNHTFYFREEEMFQFFQEVVIPTLPHDDTWRLWSAACSSGDEAYSLALLLADHLGPEAVQQRVRILGTDISADCLEQAEFGIANDRRLEKVPESLRRQYFRPVGLGQWQVSAKLKSLCTFRRLNLMSKPWPFSNQFHVIFCRNVLYYFDQPDQQELVERMYDVTVPGGWLITSVTESLRGMKTRWQVLQTGVHRKL